MLEYIHCLRFQKAVYYVQGGKGTVVYSVHQLLRAGEVLVLNDHHVTDGLSSRREVVFHVISGVLPTEEHKLVSEATPLGQRGVAVLRRVGVDVIDHTRLGQHLQ